MERVYESQRENKFSSPQVNGSTSQRKNKLVDSEARGLVDPSARGIENLYIWKESRVFVNAIYRMMSTCKDYGFRDQIQRAAVSIMNNIAEGSESGYDAKFVHFLNIAKGSCGEVKSMLYLCEDFNFCTPEERVALQSQLKKISTGIVRLIDSLNAKSTSR